MTDKIIIEPVPVTDEFRAVRRIIQPRGELALIEDGRQFRHLGYFSLKRGDGYFRGGHYHLEKLEFVYIIAGRLKISYLDMDTGESSAVEADAGSRIIIHPRCAHRFDAIEDLQVIEYFDSLHDPKDDHPFQPFLGTGKTARA